LIAAGCSGGGSTSTPTAPTKNNGSGGGTTQPSSAKVRGQLTVVIKSRAKAARNTSGKRKPFYVSPATSGVYATFTDTNSTTITYQGYTLAAGATQSATSPADCSALASDNSFTCTLYFQLSPDPYTIELDAYDTAQSGTSLSSGNALSTDTESVTVSTNTSNTFAFTLQGIVEGFNVSPQYVGASGPIAPPEIKPTIKTAFAPTSSATAQALDADGYAIDAVDTATNFASGAQPSGPFTENTAFGVTAFDGDSSCSSSPCVGTSSSAVASPASETLNFSYSGNGTSGDGTTVMPYYGVIGLTEPSGYSTGGFTSATFNGTPYASEVYIVPFFGIVDPANTTGERTDASDVSFTYPGDTVNLYALQYHLPTGSSGYTIDTSNCGSIASSTSPTPLATGYGASFELTAGSASGSCDVTLGDGATPPDTATIHVVSTAAGGATATVPCAGPTTAPDARNRFGKKRFTTACPPQHTATLYNATNVDTTCAEPASEFASLGLPTQGSVTTTDLTDGTVQVKYVLTGGDPNAVYTADVTCVSPLGTFTTDGNGAATTTFTIPSSFNAPAGSLQSFDAFDGNDSVRGGTFTI
jgi:hypothetical protein